MSTAATFTTDLVHGAVRASAPAVGKTARLIMPMVAVIIDVIALAAAASAVGSGGTSSRTFVASGVVALLAARTTRPRLLVSLLDDLPRIALAVLVATAAVAVVDPTATGSRQIGLLALGVAAVAGGRTCLYAGLRSLRRRGAIVQRAVIVGAGGVGVELHSIFRQRTEYGVQCLGIVDDVTAERGVPLIGGIADLDDVVVGADLVVVAFGPRGEQELLPVLRAAQRHDVDILVVPRFFELGIASSGPQVEHVWGIPLYRVRRGALSRWSGPLKRTVDVAVAGTLLVLIAPMLAALSLAVRFSSDGPILFRQRRVGQHGREFEVLKFRTMRENTDSDVQWNVDGDARVTRVGTWLRNSSLDELPQLWNVLRGDMSLVGPRPERPYFVEEFSDQVPGYLDRHRAPVGVTGWSQVNGLRGDTSIAERARFDNAYIENWTPWFDIKIMLRTLVAVVRSDPAHHSGPRAVDEHHGGGWTRPLRRGTAVPRSFRSANVAPVDPQLVVPAPQPTAKCAARGDG